MKLPLLFILKKAAVLSSTSQVQFYTESFYWVFVPGMHTIIDHPKVGFVYEDISLFSPALVDSSDSKWGT